MRLCRNIDSMMSLRSVLGETQTGRVDEVESLYAVAVVYDSNIKLRHWVPL